MSTETLREALEIGHDCAVECLNASLSAPGERGRVLSARYRADLAKIEAAIALLGAEPDTSSCVRCGSPDTYDTTYGKVACLGCGLILGVKPQPSTPSASETPASIPACQTVRPTISGSSLMSAQASRAERHGE